MGRDEADVRQGTRVLAGDEVQECRLEERTVLAVEVAVPCRRYAVYQPGTRVYSESSAVWDRTVLQVTVAAGLVSGFLSPRNREIGRRGGGVR